MTDDWLKIAIVVVVGGTGIVLGQLRRDPPQASRRFLLFGGIGVVLLGLFAVYCRQVVQESHGNWGAMPFAIFGFAAVGLAGFLLVMLVLEAIRAMVCGLRD